MKPWLLSMPLLLTVKAVKYFLLYYHYLFLYKNASLTNTFEPFLLIYQFSCGLSKIIMIYTRIFTNMSYWSYQFMNVERENRVQARLVG